jgi:hypothetical protein
MVKSGHWRCRVKRQISQRNANRKYYATSKGQATKQRSNERLISAGGIRLYV